MLRAVAAAISLLYVLCDTATNGLADVSHANDTEQQHRVTRVLMQTRPGGMPNVVQPWRTQWFAVSKLAGYHIVEATLRFYVRRPHSLRRRRTDLHYTVRLYRMFTSTDLEPKPLIECEKKMAGNGAWVNLPIKQLVQFWIDLPSANYGLQLRATPNNNMQTHQRRRRHNDMIQYMPTNDQQTNNWGVWLMIRYVNVTAPHTDVSRGIESNTLMGGCHWGDALASTCRARKVKVNLHDIGYTHVRSPVTYNTIKCIGQCPIGIDRRFRSSITNHDAARLLNPNVRDNEGLAALSSCVPDVTEPLTIEYMDVESGSIERRKLPNMVVKSCKCRH